MLNWILRSILNLILRVLSAVFWAFLGGMISAVIRLSPIFFRICVAATNWILARLDWKLNGGLSRKSASTYMVAGALWGIAGFIVPWLIGMAIELDPNSFDEVVAVVGFIFGLACGYKVQRLPGWGAWRFPDGIRIGENIR